MNPFVVGVIIAIVIAVLAALGSRNRRRTGTGMWVKRYPNRGSFDLDVNRMARDGWVIRGQSGDGKRIIVTWERNQLR